jgi:DMSO/TMAO reductase YedYZ molybdopterin-dependent catalytic subunit
MNIRMLVAPWALAAMWAGGVVADTPALPPAAPNAPAQSATSPNVPGTSAPVLRVDGNVAVPLALSIDDLARLPAHDITFAPGAARPPAADAAAPRHYTSVLLRDVLAAAKPAERAPRELRRSYVVARARDGYAVVFSWAEIFVSPAGDSVFVVYRRDGVPLDAEEGPVALIAVADTRPVRHVKWLDALQLRAADP